MRCEILSLVVMMISMCLRWAIPPSRAICQLKNFFILGFIIKATKAKQLNSRNFHGSAYFLLSSIRFLLNPFERVQRQCSR